MNRVQPSQRRALTLGVLILASILAAVIASVVWFGVLLLPVRQATSVDRWEGVPALAAFLAIGGVVAAVVTWLVFRARSGDESVFSGRLLVAAAVSGPIVIAIPAVLFFALTAGPAGAALAGVLVGALAVLFLAALAALNRNTSTKRAVD